MPTTNVPGFWLGDQNTKIPALSHFFSYKANLSAANTAQTIVIPTTYQNPAQAVLPGPAPSGEPPQGKRFFATHLIVRDANGALGGTAGGSIALVDQTTGVTIASVTLPTTAGSNPTALISAVTQLLGAVNPNDQMAIQYTPPTSGTATGTIFTVDCFGYWQQNV